MDIVQILTGVLMPPSGGCCAGRHASGCRPAGVVRLGVRSREDGDAVGRATVSSSSPGTVAVGLCFGVCLLAVVAGVAVVAFGKRLFHG
jgi:hypothetical protein